MNPEVDNVAEAMADNDGVIWAHAPVMLRRRYARLAAIAIATIDELRAPVKLEERRKAIDAASA